MKREMTMASTRRKHEGRRRGQTLVEFALVVPILLTLVIGIMEFGWYVKNAMTLANATREGARSASLGRPTSDIQTRVQNSAAPLSVVSPNGSLTMQYSITGGSVYLPWPADANGKNGVPVGSLIRISSTARHRTLTGFFPFLRSRDLSTFVTMRREL